LLPDAGMIQKSSSRTARYVWVICLNRIIALQNFPVEDCILVALKFGQIEKFAALNQRSP